MSVHRPDASKRERQGGSIIFVCSSMLARGLKRRPLTIVANYDDNKAVIQHSSSLLVTWPLTVLPAILLAFLLCRVAASWPPRRYFCAFFSLCGHPRKPILSSFVPPTRTHHIDMFISCAPLLAGYSIRWFPEKETAPFPSRPKEKCAVRFISQRMFLFSQ